MFFPCKAWGYGRNMGVRGGIFIFFFLVTSGDLPAAWPELVQLGRCFFERDVRSEGDDEDSVDIYLMIII